MWSTEYTVETGLDAPAIWAALSDLHHGVALDGNSDRFELHGPFAVGTELTVTPQGQDSFRSTITELAENRVYADRTEFGGLVLTFRHTLVPLPGGGTRVTHRLEIGGTGADAAGPELGPQISADFPQAMDALLAAARRKAGQADQTDPAGLTDQAGLTDPAGPTDPAGLTDQAGLTDRAGLTDLAGPTDPAGLADRAGLTDPAGPTDPAGLADPVGLTDPAGHTDPAGLAERR
jgi:hypothetical protein